MLLVLVILLHIILLHHVDLTTVDQLCFILKLGNAEFLIFTLISQQIFAKIHVQIIIIKTLLQQHVMPATILVLIASKEKIQPRVRNAKLH